MSKAILTVDLTFGDAGKGATVDALVRKTGANVVVRFNGGCQAAHNVVNNGKHHTFAQFGSGTMVPGVQTLLSQYMLVNPLNMMIEAEVLEKIGVTDAMQRTFVDARAVVTTPFHCSLNRIKELLRGDGRHGSCGMGIGETVADKLESNAPLTIAHLFRPHLKERLSAIRNRLKNQVMDLMKGNEERFEKEDGLRQEAGIFFDNEFLHIIFDLYQRWQNCANILCSNNDVKNLLMGTSIFEAAQGVLLHEDYGFPPYNTWSNTSLDNAKRVIAESNLDADITSVGIIRAYSTRHGPGPFVTEDADLSKQINEAHNGNNVWQREFRAGWLDIPAIQYALEVNGKIDYLAVNHVDQLELREDWYVNEYYTCSGELYYPDMFDPKMETVTAKMLIAKPVLKSIKKGEVLSFIKNALNIPIAITGHGPSADDRNFHISF